MVMDLIETAPANEADAIKFTPEPSKSGQVTATVPITWTLDEEALEFVATHRNSNPHLLIVVASSQSREHTQRDYTKADEAKWAANQNAEDFNIEDYNALIEELTLVYPDYSITSVHAVRLLDRAGELATPKVHISFHRAGDNIIFGKVIAIASEDAATDVNMWRKHLNTLRLTHNPADKTVSLESTRDYSSVLSNGYGSSVKRFEVPATMFARERPAWQKRLVKEFFRGYENDECHFRKRLWFGAIPLMIVVQIYGLFARVGTLLYGVVFGLRNTFNKQLFALNPHDYANSLNYSWWYSKKDGTPRSLARRIFSIPTLVMIVTGFVASILPGVVINTLFMGRSLSYVIENITSVALFSWILIAATTTVWFVFWILFTRKGHRFFGDHVADPIARAVSSLASKWATSASPEDMQVVDHNLMTLEQLKRSQAAYEKLTPSEIENDTFKLKFDGVKMQLCRPFQRPADFS